MLMTLRPLALCVLALAAVPALAQPSAAPARAAREEPKHEEVLPARGKAAKKEAHDEVPLRESLANQVRAVLEKEKNAKPNLVRRRPGTEPPPVPTITVEVGKRGETKVQRARVEPPDPGNAPPADVRTSLQYQRARAIALTGQAPASYVDHRGQPLQPVAAAAAPSRAGAMAGHGGGPVHWSYSGEGGPQAWASLQPEFRTCGAGRRQSPIHIEDSATLLGPAEPLQFIYTPSGGSVVNNGHTLQVDVEGENSLTVRGSTYRLVQFHFHHPAEERINRRGFAMVAHLVHRNAEGQLAVVAVLMDPGEPSPLIHKVWTHLPLEVGDRVRVPAGLIDLNELLPKDQRYYQFMGSLTTPPCSEGVLWMVLKSPVTLAADQLKLFSQLFPNNARPIQASNGRVVREAQ